VFNVEAGTPYLADAATFDAFPICRLRRERVSGILQTIKCPQSILRSPAGELKSVMQCESDRDEVPLFDLC
jgi:hypothetical protein